MREGIHKHTTSFMIPRTPRVVDAKGLMVALTFLVAIAIWAGERADKAIQLQTTWQKQPDLSVQIEIRPAARMSVDATRRLFQLPGFGASERLQGHG
jgi:hypothetical protein